tara:strand:- start:93 stop:1790 length:1698 start_codon:yes stop_codon:yes gene_type:complete
MSSHLEQLGFGIQPPGGINFSTNLDGVDVPGTYIELPSGEKAQQFGFSSDILSHDTGENQGVISGITDATEVKTYLSDTGHLEVVLDGPSSEVGGDGTRSLWKNGEFQPGHAQYISVGDKDAFENELKSITIDEIKERNKTNEDGVVYPAFLGISDGLQVDELDQDAIDAAQQDQAEQDGSNDLPGAEPLNIEFGAVDNIIQKLSLRNLIYPIDADFGNTQDYMQINQFTYRAPNQKLFFAKTDEEKEEFGTAPDQTLTQGLFNGSPQEKHLGLVKLPMPNSLADSNNVSWGADQLNALTAAIASGVMGQVGPGIQDLSNLITSDGGPGQKFQDLLQLVKDRIGGTFQGIQKTAAGVVENDGSINNLQVLGSSVVGSALLNAFQFGITPETILARGQGVVPNNNLSLLFNSPTLREFTFTWKLTPRSREEAQRVNNIIRFFKQGMAPKKGMNTATGAASYFLGTPNVFDLKFKTTTEGGNFFYEGDDINHSVVRIKTCACTGCAVNYTPDGMWNAYERGQPVSVTMSLRFAELEPIFDTDYDENVLNYDENRPDLHPVPIDAVGY